MRLHFTILSTCILLTTSLAAYAQEGEAGEPLPSSAATAEEGSESEAASASEPSAAAIPETKAPPTSEAGADGGRFRFGVALGAGPLFADGIDMTYYGADLRFGWQLSDALAVYAQPQLGYYKLDGASALFGSGGLIGASVVADYTLFDRAFLGAGVGYGILNNPSGAEIHLRAGGYPLMWRSDTKIRRRGIMLGVDFRMHFLDGYTFVAPTFNVGYDAF